MSWLSRHAPAIEAAAAVITACVAVAALVGVKVQLDEADRLQQVQSARDAFRAHLVLAATTPQFARPANACTLMDSDQIGAYAAFVDHLLYSAEQMLAVTDGWEASFLLQLANHRDYICSASGPEGETDETARLLARFRQESCASAEVCE